MRFSEPPPAPSPVVQQVEPAKAVDIKTANVLVAKTDIPVGTTIDSSMVDSQPWPENLVLDGFLSSPDAVVGKVVRSQIQAREPFVKSKLANPNDPSFLSAGLPTGMRAVTIAIDSISGVAGYLFPGDRVDVLFTHGATGGDKRSTLSNISEVIAPNVKVLSVGDREPEVPQDADGNNQGRRQQPRQPKFNNVTLEVSDVVAQHIRLAEKNGSLSVALRSVRDDSPTSPAPTTLNDVSRVPGGASMLIIRGPGEGQRSGKITAGEGLIADDVAKGGGR